MLNPDSIAGLATARQAARIERLVAANYSAKDIAEIEGISHDDADTRLRKIIKANNLTGRRKSLKVPYGIDSDSHLFRSRFRHLLSFVIQVVESADGHKVDIARMLGLYPAQINSIDDHGIVDIKISHLQRLARVLGVHFEDMMHDLCRPPIETTPSGARVPSVSRLADDRKAILDYYAAFSATQDGHVDATSRRKRLDFSPARNEFASREGQNTPVHQPLRQPPDPDAATS